MKFTLLLNALKLLKTDKVRMFLVLTAILLLGALFVMFKMYQKERRERIRTENNQEALFKEVEFYKTKNNENAAKVSALTLTNKEYKQYYTDLSEENKSLGIRIKRLESATQVATQTIIPIKAKVKDSIIVKNNISIPLKCISMKEPYFEITGCFSDYFEGEITIPDTLNHYAHRVPKFRLIGINFGTKGINLDVVSKNPYTKITYAKYIELK